MDDLIVSILAMLIEFYLSIKHCLVVKIKEPFWYDKIFIYIKVTLLSNNDISFFKNFHTNYALKNSP